jgi:hypothetical protein
MFYFPYRMESLGDCDEHSKSTRQLRDELRDATRSNQVRRDKGDVFNFMSVRLAEEETVVLDLQGIQKSRAPRPDSSSDAGQDETEADRKAMAKLAKKLANKADNKRECERSTDSEEEDLQVQRLLVTELLGQSRNGRPYMLHAGVADLD